MDDGEYEFTVEKHKVRGHLRRVNGGVTEVREHTRKTKFDENKFYRGIEEDIIKIIQKEDKGGDSGVSLREIYHDSGLYKTVGENDFREALSRLLAAGEIYECRTGHFKRL